MQNEHASNMNSKNVSTYRDINEIKLRNVQFSRENIQSPSLFGVVIDCLTQTSYGVSTETTDTVKAPLGALNLVELVMKSCSYS